MLCYKFMHFIQISDLCLCDFLNLIVDYKKCNIIITFLIRISMSVFVSLCCILTLCITQVILLWLKNWLKQKSGPIHIKTVYKTVNKMCTVNFLLATGIVLLFLHLCSKNLYLLLQGSLYCVFHMSSISLEHKLAYFVYFKF